ncbi:DNA-directed RNA polymerase subunit alpha [bacterium]|nr:DNA-directed RNA polymerase subunit alpha [bacterium]MDP6756173.1 DNA-directed RNA polymerase subunit alpha [Patescibacteria group bacterium]|tara:strand:- start:50305 stop:51102 length:798 start_codon:yes stop_codon:yes gene_type:complete
MESIPLPKKVSIDKDAENENKATLIIEPLYPGYGPTVGNSLRRVLLSSLPGAAIFAFKIKGTTHEFTSIDHVKEDVVDISLNLKRVNLTSHTDEPVQLTLKAEGEKVLTAGNIEKNADIEIANPDQVIMTLTDKAASIEMTLWVRTGRGYVTIESREKEELDVNAIAIDTIFTPIVQVGYEVDNVRKGARTDYDKVTMEIESNGTITIEEAIKQSAKILADHFNLISDFENIGEEEDISENTDEPAKDEDESGESEAKEEDKDKE